MALDLTCRTCQTDDHVELVEKMTGTQRRLRCTACGHEWLRGEAGHRKAPPPTLAQIRSTFAQIDDVDPGRVARAEALKVEFLRRQPHQDPEVAPYWERYQQVFSAEGLRSADPQVLKDFANSSVGANPGNQSVFNDAWNAMGAEAGAAQVRRAVDYLLRGPETTPLEDRLTALVKDSTSIGMKGFKEALLTKVLCVAYPERFLTILKYTSGEVGKREIARAVWGVELPDPERVTWTIGRLVIWSNDLLLALLGDGFETQQHAASFLWWAKDQP